MGRHDEAMNLLDNSKFVKPAPGVKPRLRILDDPYVSNRQYKSNPDIKTVFSWPVWDYTAQRVKILEKGKSVKDQIDTVEDIYGFAIPAKFDIIITTTGDGLQTRYRIDGVAPVAGPLPPAAELDNMLFELNLPKVSGGIPIGQINSDNMPQTQRIEGKADDDRNDTRTPSREDYARARAEEAAIIRPQEPQAAPVADTIITELPEGDVDLDGIPDAQEGPQDDGLTPPINQEDIPF